MKRLSINASVLLSAKIQPEKAIRLGCVPCKPVLKPDLDCRVGRGLWGMIKYSKVMSFLWD